MILDINARLSAAQALTASAASTNYYDLKSDRDVGAGEPLAVLFTVNTAADFTTGNETYTFGLLTDDNTAFSSPTTLIAIAPAATLLVANSQWVLPIPFINEQHLVVAYTLGGTTPSITVTADIVPMHAIPKTAFYPTGFAIS